MSLIHTLGEMMRKGPSFTQLFHGYLRIIATIAIISGLMQWARIIGLAPVGNQFFLDAGFEWQSAIVFFGVLDLVAGIGLWLLANWGTVIWLFLSLSKVVMHTALASAYGRAPLEIAYYICAIAIYLVLLYLFEREGRH